MKNTPENINIFIAYSHEDKAYLEELRVQLSILERINLVDKIWYDGLIQAGTDWEESIYNALENADIILLLISADFIASDFCYEKEMARAIALHDEGKVRTIPIIIRPCLWDRTPFHKLQALPEGAFPVASTHWKDKDEPYVQIVESIEKYILELKSNQKESDQERTQASFTTWIEEGNRLLEKREWNKAQAQFREALHLYQKGFQPSLLTINQKIETCQNEIYFQQNFKRAKEAYDQGDYQTALNYFQQALIFKPNEAEALKLKAACETGLSINNKEEAPAASASVVVEKQSKPDQTKVFQIKIFGMEIFKLIMAFSMIGLVATVAVRFLSGGTNTQWGTVYNDRDGIVEIVNATKMNDPSATDAKIETEFIAAKDFSQGLLAVKNTEGKWGYVSIKNGAVTEKIGFKYDGAWPHSEKEELAYVKRDGKCGFINLQGEEVIKLSYLDAASFSEGLAMVKKAEKDYAFINAKGKEVISGLDSVITKQFKNGEAWVIRNQRKILINTKGECLNGCKQGIAPTIKPEARNEIFEKYLKKAKAYREAGNYERALVVLKDALEMVQTETEKHEVENQIDLVDREINKEKEKKYRALLEKADHYFKLGDYLSALELYKDVLSFKDASSIKKNIRICESYIAKEKEIRTPIYAFEHPSKLFGIKNSKRKVLLRPQFDDATKYSNGMIAVEKNDKWGFVDIDGNIAISIRFDRVTSFNAENKAKVSLNGKSMIIDKTGKCVSCDNTGSSIDYNRYFLKKAEQLRLDALDAIAEAGKLKLNRAEYIKNCNFGLDVQARKKCTDLTKSMRGFGKITSRTQLKQSLDKYEKMCEDAVRDYTRRGGLKFDAKILDVFKKRLKI